MPKKLTKKNQFEQSKLSAVNNNNGDEIVSNGDTKVTARKRWKILAKALSKDEPDDIADVSVRRFTSFGILAPTPLAGDWLEYSTTDKKFSLQICHLQGPFTARDLIGFNNTGNICIWPSEETLAVYITSNLQLFQGKTVLELGGGMSCMAGLMLAKYACPARVHVTDGNEKSIDNVANIVKQNTLEENVSFSVLQWEAVKRSSLNFAADRYEVILVADCLFFDEVREELILTIALHLAAEGVAYVMAPQRGSTLDRFMLTSERLGFSCTKDEHYNVAIWERHVELLKSDMNYDPSLHYPILLKMTKVN